MFALILLHGKMAVPFQVLPREIFIFSLVLLLRLKTLDTIQQRKRP